MIAKQTSLGSAAAAMRRRLATLSTEQLFAGAEHAVTILHTRHGRVLWAMTCAALCQRLNLDASEVANSTDPLAALRAATCPL